MMTDLTKDAIQAIIQAVSANLDQLSEHSLPTLQTIWKALHPRKKSPHLKSLLIREIAYHMQSKQQGDLDQQSLSTLQAAKANYLRAQTANSNLPEDKNTKITMPKAANRLADGTVLKRQFNGRIYEITVMIRDNKQRFLFNQHEYKSLSKIAKEITAAHWSGPRFFGLTKLKGKQ